MKILFVSAALVAAAAAAPAYSAPISVDFYTSANDTGSGLTFNGTPFFSGTIDEIDTDFSNVGPPDRPELFAARFTGAFEIATDGFYDVTFGSDDIGYLFFDDTLVTRTQTSTNEFLASFTNGIHSFRIDYANAGGPAIVYLRSEPGLTFVTPSAVPEPANWALMIGGIGWAGGMLRSARRRPGDDRRGDLRSPRRCPCT